MPVEAHTLPPLEPPADVPEIQRGSWLGLPAEDPVSRYVAETLWCRPRSPTSWEMARLSHAAYIYRESSSGWGVVAKFYGVKAGSSAHRHAARELDSIRRVEAAGVSDGSGRAVRPLGLWRGILFLEYVRGLRLEDVIAVRRSCPGGLADALVSAGEFLSSLHRHSVQPEVRADFESSVGYIRGVVEELAKHGVLQDDPIAADGIARLIDRWAVAPTMKDFIPSLVHGDTTTTNFIFPEQDGVVVVDWERLGTGDPAFDLGRLMAEITHSINQHGGSVAEAKPFVNHVVDAYLGDLPAEWDGDALVDRARFYRASSTLRIARNGWVSRLDRTALVVQAMALLAHHL